MRGRRDVSSSARHLIVRTPSVTGGGGKGRRRGVGPIKYDVVALILYTVESRELSNLFRSRVARGFSSRFSEDVTQFTSVSTVNGLYTGPSYMMKLRDYPLPSLALIFS
jgi:hypothetical protein